MCADNVVQALLMALALGHVDRVTLERRALCVMDMAEPSATAQTLFCTGWFTLVRYLLGVMNVRNLLVPPYNPLNIRKSMLGEAL